MRPGQLLTAVTCSGWVLCFAGLLVLRRMNRLDLGRLTTN
jgi:hypothetical protein